jgi:anti-anti-sigma factor
LPSPATAPARQEIADADLPSAEVLTIARPVRSTNVRESLLTVMVHSDPSVTTVRLVGALDMTCAPRMARTVDRLLEDRPGRVVLDVSRLRRCTPRGLASILGCYQRLDDAGIPMTLRGPNARLGLLVMLYGLDEVLPMEEGPRQA